MDINIDDEVSRIVKSNLKFKGRHIDGDLIEIEALWNNQWFTDFIIQLESMHRA